MVTHPEIANSLAGELLDTIESKLNALKGLLLVAIGVAAVWFVFKEFWRTRAFSSLAPLIVTILVVLFVAGNIAWLKNQLSGEIRQVETAAHTPSLLTVTHQASSPMRSGHEHE